MNRIFKYVAGPVSAIFLCLASVFATAESLSPKKFTHADAAVILAKYSGFFDRYVSESASLNDCVAFLNETGIYFGLLEVVNGTEFTQDDFARVSGQMALVFSGEAVYDGGKVKLPNGIATWSDYCIMTDVNFAKDYQEILDKFQLMAGKLKE
jgi:hypothetical protein